MTRKHIQLCIEFPIEPAFSITVDKAQGQTMNHAILALSHRHANKCQFDYASVYVAFSRVGTSSNLRLLLSGSNCVETSQAISYLATLVPNQATKAFFAGFSFNTMHWSSKAWNKAIAYQQFSSEI